MRFLIVGQFVRSPGIHFFVTTGWLMARPSSSMNGMLCCFVETNRIVLPADCRVLRFSHTFSRPSRVLMRLKMWMPFRSPNRYGAILGFHFSRGWPKWHAASRSSFSDGMTDAMGYGGKKWLGVRTTARVARENGGRILGGTLRVSSRLRGGFPGRTVGQDRCDQHEVTRAF